MAHHDRRDVEFVFVHFIPYFAISTHQKSK